MKIRDYLKDETVSADVVTVDKKLTTKNIDKFKRDMGFDSDGSRIPKQKEELECPRCHRSDVQIIDKFPNKLPKRIFGHCNYCGYEGYWQEFVKENKE